MKRTLFIFWGLAAIVFLAFAQSMRSTSEEFHSSDKSFRADIAQKGLVFGIRVYDSYDLPVWSAWVEWDEDLIGLLSDDGRIFAAIDAEYAEANSLVTIYRDGKTESYSTNAIAIKKEKLKRVDGKSIWIKNEKSNIAFAYDENGVATELILSAVSGEVLSVSLK